MSYVQNGALMIVVLSPAVTMGAALLNMLVHWSFSWSELVLAYLGGLVLGACFMAGTDPHAGGLASFFLVFSHGLWGWFHVGDLGPFADPEKLFQITAILTLSATVAAALLDRLALALGDGVVGLLLSVILIWPLKAPWALFTTGVGTVLFIVGAVAAIIESIGRKEGEAAKRRVGSLNGFFYVEWDATRSGDHGTTLGATVNMWFGLFKRNVVEHEIYHSRQCIYFRDWYVPLWLLGGIWGLISSAIEAAASEEPHKIEFTANAFFAARHDKEVGNPLERAAYRHDGKDPL